MRKMVGILGVLFLSGSLSALVSAQDYSELGYYQDYSGDLSTLFRGRQATKYQFPFNGHCYWSAPEFLDGDIMYHGKIYRGVSLNLDANLQTPLVKVNSGIVTVAIPPSEVDWMTIDEHRFENLRLAGHTEASEGFYELLYDGGSFRLYKRVDKKIDSSAESVNGTEIGYTDLFYKGTVHTFFRYVPSYFLTEGDSQLQPVRSKSSLLRHFPDKKKAAVQYLRSLNTATFRITKEQSYIEIAKFVSR